MVDARKLAESPLVELVYDRGGVQIIELQASAQMTNALRLMRRDAERRGPAR